MIERLVLFGATGDLAGRFLLPAFAALGAAGKLPDSFQLTGAARQECDDHAFQRAAAERLDLYAADVPAIARAALVRSLRYRPVNLDDPSSVAQVVRTDASGAQPVAAYLALPPGAFATALTALGRVGLPGGSRLVVEKPFGEDLGSAVALNRLLAQVAGTAGEQAVFRVDHVLGMATVQNLLGLRLANAILDPVWNSAHIEQVEILWEETLALEGRAGYYDQTGALKDVMQNHMLQLLCLIAMEPPCSLDERDLRDRKVEVLRSVRPLGPDEIAKRTRRARYTTGRLAGRTGRTVPAYADEEGVDPGRRTETFAEVVLELDRPRWAGTRFLLRAGKALARRRKGVVVRFRPVPHSPFGDDAARPAANELLIGIDGPESLALHLTGSAAGPPPHSVPLVLTAPAPASEVPAYGRVLLDILAGGSTLSVRSDEAEQAWRVVTPVLQAWAGGLVPLDEYPAGSAGPPATGEPTEHAAAPT
jgi:glucose-6-phosphate 1-dehydrogenase